MSKYRAWTSLPNAGKIIQFKLNIGAEIFSACKELIEDCGLGYGIIIGSSGALLDAVFSNVKLRQDSYPIRADNLQKFHCQKPMEVTSISGWMCNTSEDCMIHLHCSVAADNDGIPVIYGGHLLEGIAGPRMILTVLELQNSAVKVGMDEQCKRIDLVKV
jgi:predicted DNA-binding protein with PD1-like motif